MNALRVAPDQSHQVLQALYPALALGTPPVLAALHVRELGDNWVLLLPLCVFMVPLSCAVYGAIGWATWRRIGEIRGIAGAGLTAIMCAAVDSIGEWAMIIPVAVVAALVAVILMLAFRARLIALPASVWIAATFATMIVTGIAVERGWRMHGSDRVQVIFDLETLDPGIEVIRCTSLGLQDYSDDCALRLEPGAFDRLTAKTHWTAESCGNQPRQVTGPSVAFVATHCYFRSDGDFARRNRTGLTLVADDAHQMALAHYWVD